MRQPGAFFLRRIERDFSFRRKACRGGTGRRRGGGGQNFRRCGGAVFCSWSSARGSTPTFFQFTPVAPEALLLATSVSQRTLKCREMPGASVRTGEFGGKRPARRPGSPSLKKFRERDDAHAKPKKKKKTRRRFPPPSHHHCFPLSLSPPLPPSLQNQQKNK